MAEGPENVRLLGLRDVDALVHVGVDDRIAHLSLPQHRPGKQGDQAGENPVWGMAGLGGDCETETSPWSKNTHHLAHRGLVVLEVFEAVEYHDDIERVRAEREMKGISL
jgi:hypothetical protein